MRSRPTLYDEKYLEYKMDWLKSPNKRLSLFLWLVAIHSFLVGLGLIIQNPSIIEFFGYGRCDEHFFPAQGGVFHAVMAVGYVLAAANLERYNCLVVFSIFVKSAATVFLLLYYFLIERIWTIIVSGIGDGIMMIIMLFFWLSYSKSVQDKAQ